MKANKDELFWKNKEKWETVQYFSKAGAKLTKEGWENDMFCLDVSVEGIEKSLFQKIRPVHEKYIEKILSRKQSVKENKITQKIYNHERLTLRMEHWKKLKSIYFEEKSKDETKLQIKQVYKKYFLTFEPTRDCTNQNSWRQGKLIVWRHGKLTYIFTYQHFFVLAAITLGIYSYLAIGKDIETEVAVQNGMEVLEDVGPIERLAFAIYNIIVMLYYHESLINSLKSGWNSILSVIFCKWCKASQDQTMETTFKLISDRTEVGKNDVIDL